MKYINGLVIHIIKQVILFEVKTLDEACKKAMYIEGKNGAKPTNGRSSSKTEGKKTTEGKGK